MFSIALSSEMKEVAVVAGVTGWRSIIDAMVTEESIRLSEVNVEDAVMVDLDRGARPDNVNLTGRLPLPQALETPATTCLISAIVTG